MPTQPQILDALVIGAGPAGIGTALALAAVEDLTFGVLERGRIGQTFLDWPAQQTFLTPSFTGNGFGATDLNAVHPKTSPAFSLGVDYPTGPQYARYLRGVATHFRVPVLDGTEVTAVVRRDDVFALESSRGPVLARSLVWAGGEFHEPLAPRISGSGLSDLAGAPAAWEPREGRVLVIGGYESGVDIACHHVEHGAHVTVVDGSTPWHAGAGSDPSFQLAPRSRVRLRAAEATGRLTLLGARAGAVKRDGAEWSVRLDDGIRVIADSRPIAATGYGPGLGPVDRLFARRADGWPELDDDDQSTIAPGLFLSGPAIRHGGLKFCFVYKFRQRFAHIARVIGERAGKDVSALEAWRAAGMLTDDLSCCGVECAC
ncbi:NAD(P)/FAD-dependent oxidoreductase [Microbacterium sp. No. 7]|uniref:NAD(P)/FAD-dependent oxidoreductase n=1 Tax=Microbacterium sp. No. 7 TaxID=1714373 RepID=UPI0006D0357F|nr:NAD(P)/FAD-dependent oxidoreductase [Microbacterium sp. No. 7]ALJ19793.1 pyridine nucleotide-disulfide oxidoreductase [Microbacterium sp. No. 7]